LNRAFQHQQIPGYFKVAVGAVYEASSHEVLIPLHVWLQHYKDNFSEPDIINITADQSLQIHETILYDSPTNLMKKGIMYQVWSLLDESECKTRTIERADMLEQLLATCV
jgi:hypothetical protein